ncbi:MAG TPA: PAS domain-containing protein, partial [Thermoanaerobaculia bacterium]
MTQARIFKLALCLLLSLAAVGLAAMSVQRKIESFQPLGFSALPVPGAALGIVQVDQVADPHTGLSTGDQILLVDGVQSASAPSLVQILRHKPVAELAVMRGGQVLSVHYLRPPLDIDVPYLILALIGAFYLLIGLFILIQQREGPGGLFYLWCLTSALLYLLTPTPPVDGVYTTVYLLDQIAHTFLPPLTLHLFLVFPMPLAGIPLRRLRQIIAFAYLPAAILAALQADLIVWNGHYRFGPHNATALKAFDRIDLLHLTLFAAAAVALLAYRLMRGHGWEQQRQLQWIAFGVAGGYLPFLLLYVVPFSLFGPPPMPVSAAAVLPLALLPLSFAYAILRYKLWDIGVIVRGTISLTLTLLLGGIGFSLANLAITHGISAELPGARNFLSFVSGLAIAGLLVPTRPTLSSVLERLQYRGTFGKRRALSQLGHELLHERDLGRLCSALIDRIAEGVAIEKANLYLAQGGDSLLPVRAEAGLPPVLARNDLGGGVWDSNFTRFSGAELPGEAPSQGQRLFVAGYRYAFPLTVRDRGIGIALAGFKSDQTPLNSDDILLIRHLLNQAALAIENAQLLGQLQFQLEEMQSLKSYSEGIFESSPAGIAVVDDEQRLVSVNPAFRELAAIAAPVAESEGFQGRPLREALPLAALPELPAIGEGPI